MARERLGANPSDHNQVVIKPPQRSRDRRDVGVHGQEAALFALCFGSRGLELVKTRLDLLVQRADGRTLDRLQQGGAQHSEEIGDEPEHAAGFTDGDGMGTGGQDEQRNDEADQPADDHFQNPVQRRDERRVFRRRRAEEKDGRGHRRHPEHGIDRGQDGERGQGESKRDAHGKRIAMRHQGRDRRPIERAAERAGEPVEGGLDRAADAGLGDQHRGEDRPGALWQRQKDCERVADHAGDRDAQAEFKLRLAPSHPSAHRGVNHVAAFKLPLRTKGESFSSP